MTNDSIHTAHNHGHDHERDVVTPSAASKYFCPMCPGVESDKPGDCPKCGMALERNPAWVAPATDKNIYTCPMLGVSAMLSAAIASLIQSDHAPYRWSMATAYVSLALLAATLATGPINLLRRQPNPESMSSRGGSELVSP